MMRKLVLLFAALALIFAACGDDDDSGSETTTTAAAVTTTEAPMADIALRWMTRPDNPEEAAVYAGISDELASSLNVTLAYEPGDNEGAQYQQKLLTNLSAGTAPDVFWIPGTDIADFASKDVILDLRQYADASGHSDADFYPGPMAQLTTELATGQPGNALWGLPRDVSTFGLYLNLDLIAEAGVTDPRVLEANGEWTWDAFKDTIEAVAGLGGEIKGYGQSAWWGPYGAWMNAAGGGFFNDDRTACNLDSDESIAGLAYMRDLYATGAPVPYGEDPETPFRAGTVGIVQTGRWATPGIRTVDFEWDVVGLPTGPVGPGNWLFWGAYVVNANTDNPEAAWRLVESLTTAETQAKVSANGANIPSRVSQEALDAFLTFTPPANNQAFLDGLASSPTTEGPLWTGSWPEFVTLMDSEIQAVATGARDIADFQANICTETAAAFGS
jgi:multiple sugar transport system substrate-binding protein